ncbi:MAG TPA: HNH endonuclease signature motif containing protein [Tepidisphaeraceae bacterium]|nr:HNH endonuclease signature motif containing protein [Tepidisphaeraceae bacterium]
MAVSAALRELVRSRAGDRCEYCGIRQGDDPFFRFHVEHIIARQHGGQTVEWNLAFSCHHCNLHKGPNLTGLDPLTGLTEPLFHPRTQRWTDHFRIDGVVVVGVTPVGRTTVRVLAMNAQGRLDLRLAAQSRT